MGKLLNIWSCKERAAAQSSKLPKELLSGLQQGGRWRVAAINMLNQTFRVRNGRTLLGNTFLICDKKQIVSFFFFFKQSLLNVAILRVKNHRNYCKLISTQKCMDVQGQNLLIL